MKFPSFRNKSDVGLVEFQTATMAMIARNHLDQESVEGREMVVSFSKFDYIRPNKKENKVGAMRV